DFVEAAIQQSHFDIYEFVASEIATLHRIANARLSRLDELARNRAARNFVFKHEAFAGRGLDFDFHVRVLTTSTRLLLEDFFAGRRLSDRFAISDLRLANIGFDAEFPLHPIDDDFQVQFAHAGDDRLAGFMIGRNIERRIFLGQTTQRHAQLVLIGARLRLNRDANNGSGKFDRFQNYRLVFVADGVAGRHLLHAADGDDFASAGDLNIFALVRVHAHQAADALFVVLRGVVRVGTRLDRAAVNPHERKLAEVLVSHNLEYESAERRTRIRRTLFLVTVLWVHTFDRRNVERCRQIIHDRIKQGLHTFVVKCRSGNDRNYSQLERSLAERFTNLFFANRLGFDVLVHQVIVNRRNCFNQLLVRGRGFRFQLFRNFDRFILGALRFVIPNQPLHRDDIHDTFELIF